jgi:hypothetical protein
MAQSPDKPLALDVEGEPVLVEPDLIGMVSVEREEA